MTSATTSTKAAASGPAASGPAASGPAGARLEIDWTRCDGHGLCAALLPDRITRDEWGFPILDPRAVTAAEDRAVRRAVAVCPALALRLARS